MPLSIQESYKPTSTSFSGTSTIFGPRPNTSSLSSGINENKYTSLAVEGSTEPTAAETQQIESAKKVVEMFEEMIKENTASVEKLQTEQAKLEEEYNKLAAEYDAEEDPGVKNILMSRMNSTQNSILSTISRIRTGCQRVEEQNTKKEKAVNNYNKVIEQVNKNLKKRGAEAKLLEQMKAHKANNLQPFGNPDDISNANAANFKNAGYNAQRGKQLAAAGLQTANAMNTSGLCLTGVGRSLRKVGINSTTGLPSAYQAANPLAANKNFKEVKVSTNNLGKLPAGAVVVWASGAGKPHGHISIALGNGKEASDCIRPQITNYGTSFRVFLPV